MNNKTSNTFFTFIIVSLFASCSGPVKQEAHTHASAGPLSLHIGNAHYAAIDTTESIVTWKGSNAFGTHAGYVSISKGELKIDDGQLLGGAAEIDMGSIVDDNRESDNGLIEHLKNPDFFDVQKFPLSTFVITEVTPGNEEYLKITADLTIKGITQSVTFPAKMEVKGGIIKADGSLVIDRTRWGIHYRSGKFYDMLADKSISDDIEFSMKIVAKK